MNILKYIYFFTFSFSFTPFLSAQSGCTDPLALNYDTEATENDGSCIYETTNYVPQLLTNLTGSLNEASGLALIDGALWIHNDGGNATEIYVLDSLSGQIERTLDLLNSDNEDWEDLAQSETHLFVGDFGNNSGNRTDLRIYKIAQNELSQDFAFSEFINFSYEDQTVFEDNHNNHNFDCEAFFYHNDSLHLFTKNWIDNTCKYYVLPATTGTHTAQLRSTFNTNGLITGADISPDGTVALVGYTQGGGTFMWLLYDYKTGDYFSGNKRRINLGSAVNTSQLEAVIFEKDGYGYIGAEEFSILPPKLMAFDIQEWTNPVSIFSVPELPFSVKLFPNPIDKYLNLEFGKAVTGELDLTIYNNLGQKVWGQTKVLFASSRLQIDAQEQLSSGNYWLSIRQNNQQTTLPFIKK